MGQMGKVVNTGLYVLEVRRMGPGGERCYRLLSPEPPEKLPLTESPQNEAIPHRP